ncbi:MAG: DUF932 domain-containing protein [Pirellulales bacterium]
MATLTHASRELFARSHDECFSSLSALAEHCRATKANSLDRWQPPQNLRPIARDGELRLAVGDDGEFGLNDWSFTQLCGLARVSRETVNRVFPETAARIFTETMPSGQKPLQVLTTDTTVRSIHGVSYTRLWNIELVNLVREFATDFQPPQQGIDGKTGLYAGEQDLFCFLIDPTGWIEIGGQAFAPGFFVWNSEVGKRSIGISTFWFQSVCANHIVWDAVNVVELARKHTAGVGGVLGEIRDTLHALVLRRDERRDGFVKVIERAMREKLGDDAEEVLKELARQGISKQHAKTAVEIAKQSGRFSIFCLVDALTRIAGRLVNVGDRLELDVKAAQLLTLAL